MSLCTPENSAIQKLSIIIITSLHFYTCCCTAPARPLASDLFISSMEPESMRLSWRPAALPARATTPSYLIEALEYPSTQWRPLASDVRDTSYQLTGLAPTKDYSFRVRATTPSGGLTEPTTPVTITSLPGKWSIYFIAVVFFVICCCFLKGTVEHLSPSQGFFVLFFIFKGTVEHLSPRLLYIM